MSNTKLIIEEKSKRIGNFLVGRLLPFREKRAVGPFVFIDHMGPVVLSKGDYLDVDQHPHIGLCTLTYLFDGEMEHKDSTGANKIITEGSVNLMVAGKGVTHTERTPKHLRTENEIKMHGYQVWIGLPEEFEDVEPEFYSFEKDNLPKWTENNINYTLIIGELFGHKSPTPTFSKSFMIDIRNNSANNSDNSNEIIDLSGKLFGEVGIVVVSGSIIISESENNSNDSDNDIDNYTKKTTINQGQMLISTVEDLCKFEITKDTKILIFGGEPLTKRFMYWNFVSSSLEKIEKAKEDWQNRKFPSVKDDLTYIPLP